jgi:hypothetical protein
MPTPGAESAALYATTPSLGVRVWLEDSRICLHIGNEGGRGGPDSLFLVPVTSLDPGSLERKCGLWTDDADFATFQLRHLRGPPETLSEPFIQRYSGVEWRQLTQRGAFLLAVLLIQERSSTAPDGEQATAEELEARRAQRRRDRRAALERFFAGRPPPSELRRGLVYLDPADVPPAGQPAAQPAREASDDAAANAATPPTRAAEPVRNTSMTFALASCQYPAGLMDGTPQALFDVGSGVPNDEALPGPADASMLRLARRLRKIGHPARPCLLVLTGDQVYLDATAGLFDPRASAGRPSGDQQRMADDRVRATYENWMGSVGSQSVFGLVPTRMVMDDHEIEDNWEPPHPAAGSIATDRAHDMRKIGVEGYGRYQRSRHNHEPLGHQWETYSQRGFDFFLADTRTEREARSASIDPFAPRIMSIAQVGALTRWLRADRSRPRFVVSSSMLLPRRRTSLRGAPAAIRSDAWDGYPGSLHALLAMVCREQISNVVFLSGDEHLSCVARIDVSDLSDSKSVRLHSIHSSALYAPFPFANTIEEELAGEEAWCFSDPANPDRRYRCEVKVVQWAPGDGFACLTVDKSDSGAWTLAVEFDRESGILQGAEPLPIGGEDAPATG